MKRRWLFSGLPTGLGPGGSRIIVIGCLVTVLFALPGLSAQSTLVVGVKHNISATLVTPNGPGPFPAMVVLSTSYGVRSFDRAYADRLAAEGYVCLIPEYLEAYHLTGNNRGDSFTRYAETIYADLAQAVDVLSHQDKVDGRHIGAVGFSNGGFFAVWLAARGKVQVAIDYYGAITGFGTDRQLGRLQSAIAANSSPMLLLVGDEDSYAPPTRRLSQILEEAGVPHSLRVYPGVGHEFDHQNLAMAEDAWHYTVAFLARYLKQQGGENQ